MVEGLFSLLFYWESGINQYAGQKTNRCFGASLLLLELSCVKAEIHGHVNMIILTYHIIKINTSLKYKFILK